MSAILSFSMSLVFPVSLLWLSFDVKQIMFSNIILIPLGYFLLYIIELISDPKNNAAFFLFEQLYLTLYIFHLYLLHVNIDLIL